MGPDEPSEITFEFDGDGGDSTSVVLRPIEAIRGVVRSQPVRRPDVAVVLFELASVEFAIESMILH